MAKCDNRNVVKTHSLDKRYEYTFLYHSKFTYARMVREDGTRIQARADWRKDQYENDRLRERK